MKVELKGLDALETAQWAESLGLEPYRGGQIRKWLFKRLARSFDEMTDLPLSLRKTLADRAPLNHLETAKVLSSRDGTKKFLFRLHDGPGIESVLIPEKDHFTLCISSQAGCAMGCRFCLTAKQGLKRNLSPGEIVDQVLEVKRSMERPERLTNIVLMGMGEPLANYEAVVRALRNLVADDGLNFSHRKVTLSTSGLVPAMERLGRDLEVNLAVSLNAADDDTRSMLMPVNRKYPLGDLMAACRRYPLPHRKMITFEYVLIGGVNDSAEDARKTAALLSGIRAKVNLIPFNPHPGSTMAPPSEHRVPAFQEVLLERNITAIIRKSKGRDIAAACGQLSGTQDPAAG